MTAPPVRPTIPEVLPLVNALYARPGGSVGCCLHIVIDDGNIDSESVRFCLDEARLREHEDCTHIARLLTRMTRTQIRKLRAMHR